MDGVIKLISVINTADAIGVPILTESVHEVFCQVDSITRLEFFEAGRNGLNPELRFVVFAGDYNGELTIEYNGRRYGVYRTYRLTDNDYLELYCERKSGTASEVRTDGGKKNTS